MSDEQRVRTMAGWVGVEISKSRVRTPGKEGFGLYRVRATPRHEGMESWDEAHSWTPYAFTLADIRAAVRNAIQQGRPAGPLELHLVEAATAVKTGEGGYAGGHRVPTRWTSAYPGKRNLGVVRAAIRNIKTAPTWTPPGLTGAVRAAMEREGRLEQDLEELAAQDPSVGAASARLDETVREIVTRSTMRSRQRADNAEFQAGHLERRAHGLRSRYAAKAARNAKGDNTD